MDYALWSVLIQIYDVTSEALDIEWQYLNGPPQSFWWDVGVHSCRERDSNL